MKVLIVGRFSDNTKQRIRQVFPESWEVCMSEAEAVPAVMHDANVLIPEHLAVNSRLLDLSQKLRLVQTGAGFDNVDIDECTRRNIWVCNAVGANANAVAEHTVALILSWYKNINYFDGFMKNGSPEKELSYLGSELAGKTVGIIGLGAVGTKVAKICSAFDMRVLGYRRKPGDIPGVQFADLEYIYAQSDIISLHVPLTPSTKGMIGEREFKKMKNSVLLVNTARGPLVVEKHLIKALSDREIAGACLDVFENEPLSIGSPLRALPNVILTPHTAGFPDGESFHKKRYEFFAENIEKVLAGVKPKLALNDIPLEIPEL